MRNVFKNPPAISGVGTIIVIVIIFFAQGGFGEMTPLDLFYAVFLTAG